jgi:hypothetical protein
MHSFQKKSNRLRYRIASSIGLVNKPDPEFCSMINEVTSAERRLCKFIYNVQIYKMRVTFMAKKFIKVTTIDTKSK